MKRAFFLLVGIVLLAGSLCITSCSGIAASGDYETFNVENPADFTEILVKGSHDVQYKQSTDGTTSVTVSYPDNLAEYLAVNVTAGKLTVAYKDNANIRGKSKIRVTATSPLLVSAILNGSGDINIAGNIGDLSEEVRLEVNGSGELGVKGTVSGSYVAASVNGSGDMTISGVDCEEMMLAVNGSGDAEVGTVTTQMMRMETIGSGDTSAGGSAESAVYRVKGSGNLSAGLLSAGTVEADLSGSGDIKCRPLSSLKAHISGSGKVVYYGNPESVTTTGNSSGLVHRD